MPGEGSTPIWISEKKVPTPSGSEKGKGQGGGKTAVNRTNAILTG